MMIHDFMIIFFFLCSISPSIVADDSNIENEAMAVMIGDAVSVLDLLNNAQFSNSSDCEEGVLHFPNLESGIHLLSCQSLESDARKKYKKENLFLRSRAVSNYKTERESVSGSDYLLYDLYYLNEEGNEKKIGTCFDEGHSFLGTIGEQSDTEMPQQVLDGIRITDHWRVPLSIEVAEEKVRDEKGERISLLDFSLSTGVNYELFRGERSSVTLMPTVDIPLLQDVSGPMDVLDRDNFRGSNFIPTKIGFKVQVNF
jgi:hypothetical protein